MEKRLFTAMITGFIATVILIIVILGIQPRNEIPLVEGLSWGMSPKQVTKLLGDSYNVTSHSKVTPKISYNYRTVVLGQEAEITCFFWKNKKLTEIYFQWDNNPSEIYTQAYNCLYSYYCDHKNFHLETYEDSHLEQDRVCIGTDNGVTGLHYMLERDDTSIRIICYDLK